MKFVGILLIFVAISKSSIAQLPTDAPIEQPAPPTDPPTDGTMERRPYCEPPKILFWDYRTPICDCPNRDMKPLCVYPGRWDDTNCLCSCPWWAYLTCQKNQYLDPKDCKCKCKEPCKDCSRPQVWNEGVCSCTCPRVVSCKKPRYFDYWNCKCQCNQKPRRCCASTRPWKIWSENACDCVCARVMRCATHLGYFWDSYLCKCVRQRETWWALDFAAESSKMEEGIDLDEGIYPEPVYEEITEAPIDVSNPIA